MRIKLIVRSTFEDYLDIRKPSAVLHLKFIQILEIGNTRYKVVQLATPYKNYTISNLLKVSN